MNDIRSEILAVLAERFEVNAATVTDETLLREDLDLDSIDLFDMLGIIEKRTKISIDIADFHAAKSFGDFVTTLEKLLSEAPRV